MNHATRAVGDQTSVKDRVVSARPEKLLDVLCYNNSAGTLYLLVFELSAAPADGTTAQYCFPVQSGLGGTLGRSVDMTAVYCCWSSTPLTKTLVGAVSGSIVAILKG